MYVCIHSIVEPNGNVVGVELYIQALAVHKLVDGYDNMGLVPHTQITLIKKV
jgi:hypothetical protein